MKAQVFYDLGFYNWWLSPVFCAGAHTCNVQVLKFTLNMEILCGQPLDRNWRQLTAGSLLLKMIFPTQWAGKVTIFYCCSLVNSLFWGRPTAALRRSHTRTCLLSECDRGFRMLFARPSLEQQWHNSIGVTHSWRRRQCQWHQRALTHGW